MPKGKRRLKRSERAKQNREAQARFKERTGQAYAKAAQARAKASYWKRRGDLLSRALLQGISEQPAELDKQA